MAVVQPAGYAQYHDPESERTTCVTLRSWARTGERYDVFTCCDATTAHWLCLGGARVLLVSCRAVAGILGATGVPVSLMASIGASISRTARDAFVIVDYPIELAEDFAEHADQIQRLHEISRASAVNVHAKSAHLGKLLTQPALATVPIVVNPVLELSATSFRDGLSPFRAMDVAAAVTATLLPAVAAGVDALFLESMDPMVAKHVVKRLQRRCPELPIMGCNTGDACPGHVHLLHDVAGFAVDESSSAGLGVEIVGMVRRCLHRASLPAL